MSGAQPDPVVRIDPAIWQQISAAPDRLHRPLVLANRPLSAELADEQWAAMSLAFWVADTLTAMHARGGDVVPVLDQLVADCAGGSRPSRWPWPRMQVTDELHPSAVGVIGVVFGVVADGCQGDPVLQAQFDLTARRLIDAVVPPRQGRVATDRASTGSL